jgi:hypothetical protein
MGLPHLTPLLRLSCPPPPPPSGGPKRYTSCLTPPPPPPATAPGGRVDDKFPVVVTSYEILLADIKFMCAQRVCVCVCV